MARQKIVELLAEWRSITPEMVKIEMIETDDKYQARDVKIAPFKHRDRLERASAQHIEDLTLKMGKRAQLDPVLLARIEDALYVVDGHHRLQAYRKKKRDNIPAHIRESTEIEAVMVSKLVNCDGTKLPMYSEQKRESAWQHLAHITTQGRRELPQGVSIRKIAVWHGVSKNTVTAMLKKLPKVKRDDYNPEACDPGTDWPQWRHVKGNAFRDMFDDVDKDILEQHRTERLAIRMGALLEAHGIDRFVRALALLEIEELNEAADGLDVAEVTRMYANIKKDRDYYSDY